MFTDCLTPNRTVPSNGLEVFKKLQNSNLVQLIFIFPGLTAGSIFSSESRLMDHKYRWHLEMSLTMICKIFSYSQQVGGVRAHHVTVIGVIGLIYWGLLDTLTVGLTILILTRLMIIYVEGAANDATLIFINQFLFLCLQSKKILLEFFIKATKIEAIKFHAFYLSNKSSHHEQTDHHAHGRATTH